MIRLGSMFRASSPGKKNEENKCQIDLNEDDALDDDPFSRGSADFNAA